MIAQPQSRPLTFQVTVTILGLAVAMAGIIIAFGLFTMLRVDRDAAQRQAVFVGRGLEEQRAGLAREQESVTVWDDAVTYAKAGDQNWMAENLTVWMNSYYGHDRVYVLDDHDRPMQAMVDGALVPTARYAEVEPELAPAIARLRAELAGQEEGGAKPTVADLVGLPDGPALVGIMPIVPNSDRVAQTRGSEFLHISIQRIDAALIKRISEQYQLANARVLRLTEPAEATVPLVDYRGILQGYIGWNPDRPGLAFVRETAPAIAASVVIAGGLLLFLLRRLRRVSGLLQRSQDEANYLAFHDTLTRLPNRALFDIRLRRALAETARDERILALLYLDLDRFKQINDTLGHAAGDELIRQVGGRLQALVHGLDTVARLGGDEFAILLVRLEDTRSAEIFAELVLATVAQPYFLDAGTVTVGVSVGIAAGPGGDMAPTELLRRADIALYQSKRAGGDRYAMFSEAAEQDARALPIPPSVRRQIRSAIT